MERRMSETLEEKIRKVIGPKTFNDRILKEGFPDGWFVQDRLEENVALLVSPAPGSFFGTYCLCLRPKAVSTDEWLPTARMIAQSIQSMRDMRDTPSRALVDVSNERSRQLDEDEFVDRLIGLPPGTHALAGAVYALPKPELNSRHGSGFKLWRVLWPFAIDPDWKSDRENLVTAAALILREIEEMDRQSVDDQPDPQETDDERN
jgi:hypothetical protein